MITGQFVQAFIAETLRIVMTQQNILDLQLRQLYLPKLHLNPLN